MKNLEKQGIKKPEVRYLKKEMIVEEKAKEYIGGTKISRYDVIKSEGKAKKFAGGEIIEIPEEEIYKRLMETVIIVPTRNEPPRIFEAVLKGLPPSKAVIAVSNSSVEYRENIAEKEMEIVERLNGFSETPFVYVHQRNIKIANIFQQECPWLISPATGYIRNGKGEACILAWAVSQLFDPLYAHHIDADNFCPPAANRFAKDIAAGSILSKQKSNTRIIWPGKLKIGKLTISDIGRVSQVTNKALSMMLSDKIGKEIKVDTSNAGEQGFAFDVLLKQKTGKRFGIETQSFLEMLDCPDSEIVEMRSNSFLIHSQREDDRGHIDDMIQASLSIVYHYREISDRVREYIERTLKERDLFILPAESLFYPALGKFSKSSLGELENIVMPEK